MNDATLDVKYTVEGKTKKAAEKAAGVLFQQLYPGEHPLGFNMTTGELMRDNGTGSDIFVPQTKEL